MLETMARIHFESVPDVRPDDDHDERARRRAVPVGKVTVAAILVSVASLVLAWMQHRAASPTATRTWAEVREEARSSTRNVAVFFTRADCVRCVRMEAETLADPGIRALLDRRWVLHRVSLDEPGGAALAADLGVETPPAVVLAAAGGMVLLDAAGDPLRATGFLDTEALRSLLTRPRAGEDDRRRRDDGHGGVLRVKASA